MLTRRLTMLALAVFAALCLSIPAAAAAACPKTSVADIEDEVMCPVCGTPLALATEAPQAKRERAFILDLVARCRSKSEAKAALAAEFGDRVLALPPDDGFGLAAYLVPGLALLGAAIAIGLAAIRWRRAPAAGIAPATESVAVPGSRDAERLEDDMRRYDL